MNLDIIYTKSQLFQSLQNECDDLDKVKNIIDENFSKRGSSSDEVHHFLNNYKDISYTDENVNKYVELVDYHQYNIMEDFLDYLFQEYFLQKKILEKICHLGVIQNYIQNICSDKNVLTDDILIYFSQFITIKELNAYDNEAITNKLFVHLIVDLEKINIAWNRKIDNNGLKQLLNLKVIDVFCDKYAYDMVQKIDNINDLVVLSTTAGPDPGVGFFDFPKSKNIYGKFAKLIGVPEGTALSGPARTKKLYEILQKKNLQYSKDRRIFRVDDEISDIFDIPLSVNDSIRCDDNNGFNFAKMQFYIKKGMLKYGSVIYN